MGGRIARANTQNLVARDSAKIDQRQRHDRRLGERRESVGRVDLADLEIGDRGNGVGGQAFRARAAGRATVISDITLRAAGIEGNIDSRGWQQFRIKLFATSAQQTQHGIKRIHQIQAQQRIQRRGQCAD